ncbi:Cdc6/Cdc18 family protein [Palaeococcus ferrophilus]|uniref:Cdc6/Cdc18 family protein n=1 Tax=Palaeococcus ferrophilus TaxID=83868 RepID=UPI00064E8262|nr:AAA family ATPase [Palaeococcus ferrophilus]
MSNEKNVRKSLLRKHAQTKSVLIHPEYLSESYVPSNLLFREDEIAKIFENVGPFLAHSITLNLFIHGPPGVGKTAAARLVERTYNRVATTQNIPSRAIYVSAKDKTYRYTLIDLATALSAEKRGPAISEVYDSIVDAIKRRDIRYLIIVDEIDKMKTYSGVNPIDDLAYGLSRLNESVGRPAVNLILITNQWRIMREQLSAPSLSSLTPIPIHFRPYMSHELFKILEDRVKSAFLPGTVDEGAIALLADLIQRESRDLHWAFLVLRNASRFLENGKVTEDSIWKAIEEV